MDAHIAQFEHGKFSVWMHFHTDSATALGVGNRQQIAGLAACSESSEAQGQAEEYTKSKLMTAHPVGPVDQPLKTAIIILVAFQPTTGFFVPWGRKNPP